MPKHKNISAQRREIQEQIDLSQRDVNKEKWRGKTYFVARVDGRVVSRRPASEIPKGELRARSIFKSTGTLYTDRFRVSKSYYRVAEHSQVLKFNEDKGTWNKPIDRWRQPKSATGAARGQYFFRASVNGSMVYAASDYGTRRNLKEMRRQAQSRFLCAVAARVSKSSDEEIGRKYMEKREWRGVNEGVKYFTPKQQYSSEYYSTGGMGRQDISPVFNATEGEA
jgi:hypothetical protein